MCMRFLADLPLPLTLWCSYSFCFAVVGSLLQHYAWYTTAAKQGAFGDASSLRICLLSTVMLVRGVCVCSLAVLGSDLGSDQWDQLFQLRPSSHHHRCGYFGVISAVVVVAAAA